MTLCERARQLVYQLLPIGRCFVEELAQRLDMNSRTLHRYLARDGETFSSIVMPCVSTWRGAMWKTRGAL